MTLDDSVRMALLVVLEQLSPGERVAFTLHDVFQYTVDDMIMSTTPAACRQLASRERMAERLFWWINTFEVTLVPMPVNAGPGALALHDGELMAVLSFVLRDGVIIAIHSIANPEKLTRVKGTLAQHEGREQG